MYHTFVEMDNGTNLEFITATYKKAEEIIKRYDEKGTLINWGTKQLDDDEVVCLIFDHYEWDNPTY